MIRSYLFRDTSARILQLTLISLPLNSPPAHQDKPWILFDHPPLLCWQDYFEEFHEQNLQSTHGGLLVVLQTYYHHRPTEFMRSIQALPNQVCSSFWRVWFTSFESVVKIKVGVQKIILIVCIICSHHCLSLY